MRHFKDTLIGLGPICNAGCMFTFDDKAVTIRDSNGRIILGGWRDEVAPRLWRINLAPDKTQTPQHTANAAQASLAAYSAYDLPSVSALVKYFHACAGFPVRKTWLASIKAGNFES